MTEVFINNEIVFFEEGKSLKLTIENAFFEDSGSYTLDISFPLSIEQNLRIFGCVNRMDVSKRQTSFEAEIKIDNKTEFKGSAKITNITDEEIKLQLLSGNSRVKFWTRAEGLYIDELQYEYTDCISSLSGYVGTDGYNGIPIIKAGAFPGVKGVYCYVPVQDENGSAPDYTGNMGIWNAVVLAVHNDDYNFFYKQGATPQDPKPFYISIQRDCICPNLMFVAKWVFKHLGYELKRNDRDNDFINGIYIATALNTTIRNRRTTNFNSADEMAMAKALPHWTVEEFIKQLQNFLNVTVVFDDINQTVDIIADAFTDGKIDITADVMDEYEVEVIDDEDVVENLYDSNINYKKSDSGYDITRIIDYEVIKNFEQRKCTLNEFVKQLEDMDEEEQKRIVWTTEEGQFCIDGNGNIKRFNLFGGIVRNEKNDNDIELKIAPVAITTDIKLQIRTYSTPGNKIYIDSFSGSFLKEIDQRVLSLKNQYAKANEPTVWDAINDNAEEGTEKEDIMQVFLMDDVPIDMNFYGISCQMPFTHWGFHPAGYGYDKLWSLSLSNDKAEHNIGKLHETGYKLNRNTEHHIKFHAEHIPSVYSVFYIRNKRYACKKLEVNITEEGLSPIITGYFEEILE